MAELEIRIPQTAYPSTLGSGTVETPVPSPAVNPAPTSLTTPNAGGATPQSLVTPQPTQPAEATSGPGFQPKSADTAAALIKKNDEIESHMVPNFLNDYYNVAYHFKLFATGDGDLLEKAGGKVSGVDKVTKYVIAETGITGANIREVKFQTIPAQNAGTGNMPVTTFEMQITDPLGVGFLDSMFSISKLITTTDTNKAYYYLELTFTGYDESGKFAGRPLSKMTNGGTWLWALNINKINTKITHLGTTYILTATEIASTHPVTADAQNNTPNPLVVATQVTIVGNTVKEMYDSLKTELNKQWKLAGIPISVKDIKVKPVPFEGPFKGKDAGAFSLKPEEPGRSNQRTLSFTNGQNGKVQCQVAAGTSINELLTSIITSTESGQQLLKGLPLAVGEAPKDVAHPITFSVDPDIKQTGQDPISKHYIKEVTFNVIPHSSSNIAITQEQVQASQDSPEKVIDYLIKNGFFKKRYDYIFTGKNTEVLNLNIDFNLPWSAQIAALDGSRAGTDSTSINAKTNKANETPGGNAFESFGQLGKITDFESFIKDVSDVIKIASNNITAGINAVKGAIASVETSITEGINEVRNTVSHTIDDISTGISKEVTPIISNVDKTIGGAATTVIGGIASVLPTSSLGSLTGTLSNINLPLNSVASTLTSKLTSPFGKAIPETFNASTSTNIFVEDLNGKQVSSKQANSTTRTVAFSQKPSAGKTTETDGMNKTYHRDKTMVGAVLDQLYNNSSLANSSLIMPEIEIRGDPYWLGMTNMQRTEKNRSDETTHNTSSSATPDMVSGPPFFQIHFYYPIKIGVDDPEKNAKDDFRPVLQSSEVFNGIYMLIQATHIFSANGEFRQILKGTLNPLTSISSVFTNGNGKGSGSGAGQHPVLKGGKGNIAPPGTQGIGDRTVLPTNPQRVANMSQIHDQLIARGYNEAAVAGILANLQAESQFIPGIAGLDKDSRGNQFISYGLVQWNRERYAALLAYSNANGGTLTQAFDRSGNPLGGQIPDMNTQVNFMLSELNSRYSSVNQALLAVPNTEEGAKQASLIWTTRYEVGTGAPARAATAPGFFRRFGN